MTQKHTLFGTFHITTNAKGKVPWLICRNIPEVLIDNLVMTRNLYKAELYAFCILPNHMHILLRPGKHGLSAFMHSFKRNAMKDIRRIIPENAVFYNPNLRRCRSRSAPCGIQTINTLQMKSFTKSDIYWQRNFHDERIRDAMQRTNALTYIHYNAWKHGMGSYPENWPWSSLHFQHLIDPTDIFE